MKLKILSDFHVGNKMSRVDLISKVMAKGPFVICGDLVEGIIPSDFRFSRDNEFLVDEQISFLLDLLRKKDVRMILSGNHEESLRSKTSVDVLSVVAKEMDIYYPGHSGFLDVDGYTLYCTHGNGGGMYIGTWMTKLERLMTKNVADVFCMGHSHQLFTMKTKIDSSNGAVDKWLCNTGSFLEDPLYARDMNLPPSVLGYVEFDSNKFEAKAIYL